MILFSQVASRVLKIPTSKVHISETATNHVPNTSPTAASMSSDLYGMAIVVYFICDIWIVFIPMKFGCDSCL